MTKKQSDVLVVEDDPDIVALIVRSLNALGMNVVSADDVWTGIELFRQIPYDLVITDYRVGSETARTFVQAVRQDDVDIPILLMSGRMEKEDFGQMIREAVDDFVGKPIDLPEFFGAVNRLLTLGDQRARTKKRAAKLLEVSSRVKIGARAEETLQLLVRTVADITPFQVAVLDVVDDESGELRREVVQGTRATEGAPLQQVRNLFDGGYRFEISSFVPGDPAEMPRQPGQPYHQTTLRERPWKPEDQILVEIRSEGRLWGYLRVASPSDELRPTEDSMRMLSLLGHNFANTLENRRSYQRQQRLSSQLGIVSEVVKAALGRYDLDLVKKMLSEVAVTRFENSFSCFIDKTETGWHTDAISCRDIAEYARTPVFSDSALAMLEEMERSKKPSHLRSSHGEESLVSRPSMRTCLAIPISTRDTLRHIFVVEDDRRSEFSSSDITAYTTLADQIGLIWSGILHRKHLENTTTELNESYQKLKEANALNVRLQSILKRYVPASTWESVLQSSEEEGIEKRIEAHVECAVMFIDVVGFTKLSETATPAQLIDLLNGYFTMMASIVSQMKGEVIKYIGDGIMAYFDDQRMAIRAADDIIKSQGRLNRSLESLEVGSIGLRVGVSWGSVVLGHVGPFYHQDRTLLGDTVNTASRLEHAAKPGTALLDANLLPEEDRPEDYELVRIDSIIVRGKVHPVPVMTFARDGNRYLRE